jgi:hypothetical protein
MSPQVRGSVWSFRGSPTVDPLPRRRLNWTNELKHKMLMYI